ncbi:hypothetical protein ACFLXD_00140 [Chloroflexota bacterium]
MTRKLVLIKMIHTVIFVFMSSCLVYLLYSGITRTYNWALFFAIGAIFIEGIVLLFNRFQCPFTTLARKYGDKDGSITDMFYPKWFVPYVFRFSTILFAIGLIILGLGYFTGQ